jgi:hypothetical protein
VHEKPLMAFYSVLPAKQTSIFVVGLKGDQMRVYKDGAKVASDEMYILDPASIRVGDIILSTDPFSADSELIKIATGVNLATPQSIRM